jgi:FAD dependent oxidoreductase TIGR03364
MNATPSRSATGSTSAFDVVIIGSGIVGLGHALAASDRGLSVVVVDRAATLAGASVRNFGHLCFTPQAGLAREFAARSRPLWLRLATDADVWLRQCGTVVIARHADELRVLAEVAEERGGTSAFGAVGLAGDHALRPEIAMLSAAEVEARTPVAPGTAVGGAFLPADLQVNPRQAGAALAGYLTGRGVEFRYRTAVTSVRGGAVETTRGRIDAGTVIVAVNHDIDQLFPEVAERVGIRRCGLDMLRVDAGLAAPLGAPLLTGWSLLRYAAFAGAPSAAALRDRLHRGHPSLAALDLNQMYTQLPDGSLIVGDTHYRDDAVSPFQAEGAFDALLDLTAELFAVPRPRVIERWQGVYASGPNDFLIDQPEPGVHLIAATTGIGMTTGLGLAESVVAGLFDSARSESLLTPPRKGAP